jgi:methionyl-tRNA formyltransferase
MNQVCIAGKNSIAINSLKVLINDVKICDKDLCVIPNRTDKGIDNWQPSLKKFAFQNNIPILNLHDIYDRERLIFISLEFDRIIKPHLFKSKNLYNIHFSKLPHYKGMYTSAWPIINGEKYSGVTLHCIDEGIDTGDLIDQSKFSIPLSFTAKDLYLKYLKYGLIVFKRNIINLLNGNIKTHKQSVQGSYYDKKSIDYQNINIDLNKTSFEIYNQIRAFIFPEYQYPKINNCEIVHVSISDIKIEKRSLKLRNNILILSGIDGFEISCLIND